MSSGTFQGQNGLITWTVTTTMLPGETKATSRLTFSSPQPFGNVRVITYLDEDVGSPGDDILRTIGVPGQPGFLAFTLDGPQRVGFAQGGAYVQGADLVNATWDGWTADSFDDLESVIKGAGANYSPAGNINSANLPAFNDPSLGAVHGPADVTTAFAWTLNPTARSATVTTLLQGVAKTSDGPTGKGTIIIETTVLPPPPRPVDPPLPPPQPPRPEQLTLIPLPPPETGPALLLPVVQPTGSGGDTQKVTQTTTSITARVTEIMAAGQQRDIALLTYLGDADQLHLLGVEFGDEEPEALAQPDAHTVKKIPGSTAPNASDVQADVTADLSSGLSPWWTLAGVLPLIGGRIAWIFLHKRKRLF